MSLSHFDYGRSLHGIQQLPLGQEIIDNHGDRWGYVRVEETAPAHRVMVSLAHDVMFSGGTAIAASEAQPRGSKLLTITPTNAYNFVPVYDSGTRYRDLTGCHGIIVKGDGIGQHFFITKVESNSKVRVGVINSDSGGGWITPLSTTSEFILWFPGVATVADEAEEFIEGVCHVEVTQNDIGKFTYLQRSGLGLMTLDKDGETPSDEGWLALSSDGLVEGVTVPGTTYDWSEQVKSIRDASGQLAQALHPAEYGLSDHSLMLCAIDVHPVGRSYKVPNKTNSFNDVKVRAN